MGVTFTQPRPLEETDDVAGFCCGLGVVDTWVRERARTARQAGTAVVYVSFLDGMLAGFYTLSSHAMLRRETRGWLSRNAPEHIPVILLGMLGVDKRFQGGGLGRNLLLDATKRALSLSSSLGARALVVDPATEDARRLYASCGFRDVPESSRMFVKLT